VRNSYDKSRDKSLTNRMGYESDNWLVVGLYLVSIITIEWSNLFIYLGSSILFSSYLEMTKCVGYVIGLLTNRVTYH
jgi:hypothetical protein